MLASTQAWFLEQVEDDGFELASTFTFVPQAELLIRRKTEGKRNKMWLYGTHGLKGQGHFGWDETPSFTPKESVLFGCLQENGNHQVTSILDFRWIYFFLDAAYPEAANKGGK